MIGVDFGMRAKKGFTLVELIITVAVLVIIMVSMGGALVGTLSAWKEGRDRELLHEYETQARTALLAIVRDIRNSKAVTEVGSGLGDTLVLTTDEETPRTITYTLEEAAVGDSDTRFVLKRGFGSPPDYDDPDPPWPINFVPVRLNSVSSAITVDGVDITVNGMAIVAGRYNAGAWEDVSAPYTNATHLRIYLDPQSSTADNSYFANTVFQAEVSLKRLPLP